MNISSGSEHTNVCEGCLSYDRTLSPLNDELISVYSSFIQENEEEEEEECCRVPLLCWECAANIIKFIKFKRRCLQATNFLNKHTVLPTNMSSLSRITITKVNSYNIPVSKQNNNYEYDIKEEDSLRPVTDEVHLQIVKVEQNLLEDVEECFVNDDFFYQDVNNKDTAHNKNGDSGTTVTTIKDTNNKTDDEFDCSDDEPLHNKRTTSLTVKKKKKRKEKGGGKVRGNRREAPAGVVENPRVRKKLQQLNVPDGLLQMVVLTWEQVEEERQKAMKSEVFTRHMYRCYSCVVGFNHRHKLDNHMKKHHPTSGELVCEVCTVRFRERHALTAHRRRHRLRWVCARCGGAWSRACVAADHAARHHSAPTPTHTCAYCSHRATTLGKLRSHMKIHAQRQECQVCGKSFRDTSSLRTHLFIHDGEKEYSCPRCDKRFLFKKAMEVHMVTHEESAHLYCYQCDVNFKNRMSYSQHMKYSLKHIHPDKLKYACSLCDKKFAKAVRLREHHTAIHLKITPVHCPEDGCTFACSSRPVLRTHARHTHGAARSLRNHVCHSCGKTYTTKKALEGHLRSHSGERPFKCGVCPSTFGYEAALYNHNKLVHQNCKTKKKSAPPLQEPPTTMET